MRHRRLDDKVPVNFYIRMRLCKKAENSFRISLAFFLVFYILFTISLLNERDKSEDDSLCSECFCTERVKSCAEKAPPSVAAITLDMENRRFYSAKLAASVIVIILIFSYQLQYKRH